MLDTIKIEYPEYANKLSLAYANSNSLGLSPKMLQYRAMDEGDFRKLYQVIDAIQPQLQYDHLHGACLMVHSILKQEFAKIGYFCELVIGDVIVNGVNYIDCNLETLTAQLEKGVSNEKQNVHCWLLLPSGQMFDATIIRDLSEGKQAAEIHGMDKIPFNGNILEYVPMLIGTDFVSKTNPIPQL